MGIVEEGWNLISPSSKTAHISLQANHVLGVMFNSCANLLSGEDPKGSSSTAAQYLTQVTANPPPVLDAHRELNSRRNHSYYWLFFSYNLP